MVNTTVRKNRKYICTFDCGRSGKEDPRKADVAEFRRGEIYTCQEDGFLVNDFGEKRRISERALKLFFKQYRKPKEIVAEGLFPNDEITRFGFIAHLEHFIKQLLKDPKTAKVDSYLERHGIDSPKAVEILIKRDNPDDEKSAVLIRKERIEDGGYDEEGKRLKDKFHVKYILPRAGYDKKLKKIYVNLFENYRCDNPLLNEEDAGGAIGVAMGSTTTFGDTGDNGSGQFITPFKPRKKMDEEDTDVVKKPIYTPKTIQITEEQLDAIREATTTFGMTPQGNAMGDMTPPGAFNDDETNNHKDMMKKSFSEYKWNVNEEGIHIKEKNKGKFTATKKKTGKSTEELTHSKNPLTRKRAQFALNAKKWHHKKKK